MDSSPEMDVKMARRATLCNGIALACFIALALIVEAAILFSRHIALRSDALFLLPIIAGLALAFRSTGRFAARQISTEHWIFLLFFSALLWYASILMFPLYPSDIEVKSESSSYIAHVTYWAFDREDEDTVKLYRPVTPLFYEREPIAYARFGNLPGYNDAVSRPEKWPSIIESNLDAFVWR